MNAHKIIGKSIRSFLMPVLFLLGFMNEALSYTPVGTPNGATLAWKGSEAQKNTI